MKLEPFKPEHIRGLLSQKTQRFISPLLMDERYVQAIAQTDSWSCSEDGHVYACGGIVRLWDGNSQAWALFDDEIGPRRFLKFHHITKRMLKSIPGRVETFVEFESDCAHKWAHLLGFEYEGRLRKWFPGGADAAVYGRIT